MVHLLMTCPPWFFRDASAFAEEAVALDVPRDALAGEAVPPGIDQATHPTGSLLVGILVCLRERCQTLPCHEVIPTILAVCHCHSSKADC